MTVGFKTDNTSSSRYNSMMNNKTNKCKILKMELSKIDEVQEIDF